MVERLTTRSRGPWRLLLLVVVAVAWAVVAYWWLGRDRTGGSTRAPAQQSPDSGIASEGTESLPVFAPEGSFVHAADAVPSANLRILVSTPEPSWLLCTVGSDEAHQAPLSTVSCTGLPTLGEPPQLVSGEAGSEPLLFLPPDRRIVRARDGSELWPDSRGAFARNAGGHVALRARGTRFELEGSELAVPIPVTSGPGPSPALLWDRVVWTERSGTAERLKVRGLDSEEEIADVGPTPPNPERFRACRSADALAIVVDGELVHEERRIGVTFLGPEGWTTPVGETAGIFDYELTCRGTEATLTWVEGGAAGLTVVQVRCRPAGCERTTTAFTPPGTDPMAADLAGRTLLVWAAEDGTRARLAPLVELGTARDMGPLHDARLHVLARRLYVRGGVAVVVLRTAAGLSALRIDAGGRVSALELAGG